MWVQVITWSDSLPRLGEISAEKLWRDVTKTKQKLGTVILTNEIRNTLRAGRKSDNTMLKHLGRKTKTFFPHYNENRMTGWTLGLGNSSSPFGVRDILLRYSKSSSNPWNESLTWVDSFGIGKTTPWCLLRPWPRVSLHTISILPPFLTLSSLFLH